MTDQREPSTLLEILGRGASSHPALVSPGGVTITYDALRRQVNSLASQLRSMRLASTDRVAIVLPNGIEAIIVFLAAASAATAAPLNPGYKLDEFKFYLEDTRAKALITSAEVGAEARKAADLAVLQIGVSSNEKGEFILSATNEGRQVRGGLYPNPDDTALVLHTSGTTSRPKRVPLTHRNLSVSVGNVARTYDLNEDDVSFCVMPLFHVHGLVASTLATFYSGGTVVVPPRFNALGFWKSAKEYNATWFSAVPSVHQALVHRAGGSEGGEEAYPGLRFIRSCSAALSPSTMREMEERFGVPVLEAYGMTEAAHQMASNPLPPGKRAPGSVGRGTGVKIGIMDAAGNLLPTGAHGEVVIQGANVIRGYEDNPEANASSFTNGWFRTGDEGVLDAEGYLRLVGRIKELINRSGEKIAPIEIDQVLLMHPAVAEAVAFGVAHSVHGEEPSAAVVLRSPATISELVAHCRAHLADFKCPKTIHIVEAIPRTATGKVQRRAVAAALSGKTA